MDYQIEVEGFFDKLSIWREESHKEFANILKFHSSSINKGFSHLVEEISDLKVELSVITKERNDLLETVHNLSNNVRQRSAELPISQPMRDPEEIQAKNFQEVITSSPEVEDNKEQSIEKSTISNETVDEDDITFNECPYSNIVETESYEVDKEIHKQKETEGKDKRKEIPLDSTQNKCLKYESKSSNSPVHDDDYFCPECNFPFSRSENLEVHLKNVHPKLKLISNKEYIHKEESTKFKCEMCPYSSKRKTHLKRHITAVHENIRNHVCGECGYAASRKTSLKRHIESVHENIRKHVCEECGYAALGRNTLKRHIDEVHKNIRNHVCGDCGYAASRKDHLTQHIAAVHENIRNHVCGECGYTASEKHTLKKHIEALHKV